MNLQFDVSVAAGFKSESQRIRVMSEYWAKTSVFCPSCGKALSLFDNNQPVADLYCAACREEFELKSKNGSLGQKLNDGAFDSMIGRLESDNNPNLFLLSYQKQDYTVRDFLVIPKHFFTPSIIEKRKPLAPTARRAGWVGCNILVNQIPNAGRIYMLRNGLVCQQSVIIDKWQKTLFLRKASNNNLKGWLLDTMNCIDSLNTAEFALQDIYKFESLLAAKHPDNHHIRDKIRQQLQYLRDKGYIEFVKPGRYRLG